MFKVLPHRLSYYDYTISTSVIHTEHAGRDIPLQPVGGHLSENSQRSTPSASHRSFDTTLASKQKTTKMLYLDINNRRNGTRRYAQLPLPKNSVWTSYAIRKSQ